MNKTLYLIFICLLLCAGTHLVAQTFDYNRVSGHPRLLMKQGEEQQIRESLKDNPEMQRVYKQIVGEADRLLVCPTLTYKKEGRRLLAVSREALKRIFDLSFVYRMTGEDKYRLRAEQEMVSVCSFGDWNPSHFLDVGEMTMAVAIGYDWLFDKLSPETRRVVRESILQKGFAPSNDKQYNWFLKAENNWNQVCNTGLVYGALALLDSDSKEAAAVIERAMSSVPLSMKVYAPDGNYPEGYNYWGYGTSFNVMLIAALESALGSDGGLSAVEGFMSSARFMQYMAGNDSIFSGHVLVCIQIRRSFLALERKNIPDTRGYAFYCGRRAFPADYLDLWFPLRYEGSDASCLENLDRIWKSACSSDPYRMG